MASSYSSISPGTAPRRGYRENGGPRFGFVGTHGSSLLGVGSISCQGRLTGFRMKLLPIIRSRRMGSDKKNQVLCQARLVELIKMTMLDTIGVVAVTSEVPESCLYRVTRMCLSDNIIKLEPVANLC